MSSIFFEYGSKWLKADFHLHTKSDKEFTYNQNLQDKENGYPEENTFPNDYISALKKAGINIGVITNHNKFNKDEFDCLRKKARKENILLFPGVELNVNEGANGVHTLIVFSDDWISDGKDYINSFLTNAFSGQVPEEYQNKNGRTKENLLNIIERLDSFNKDYFIIFAHVNQVNGIFKECGGGKISEFASSLYEKIRKRVLAFQKVRDLDTKQKVQKWLNGWYPAEVEGSDCKSLKEIGSKDGETWLKIGELSYNAVKNALLDFTERVRTEPEKISHSYIKSVSFDGGIFDGKKISFSPELNTLIGIRGSGKSSLLETIRYGLGLELSDDVLDKKYKQNLISYVLGSGGKIIINAVSNLKQEFEISRIYREMPKVYIDGKLQPGLSIGQTVLKNPLYFGQKELAANGENFGNDLINKLVGNKLADIKQKILVQNQKIQELVHSLTKTTDLNEQIEETENKIKDVKFRLKTYSDYHIEEKLKKQTEFDKDAHWLENADTTLNSIGEKIKSCLNNCKQELSSLLSYQSSFNEDIASSIKKEIQSFINLLNKIEDEINVAAEFAKIFSEQKSKFDTLNSQEQESFAEIRRELEKKVRDDGLQNLKIEDFKKLNISLTQFTELLNALKEQESKSAGIQNKLFQELDNLNNLHREEFKIVQDELQKLNSEKTSVSFVCEFKNDKDSFLEMLKNIFRGSGIREQTYKDLTDSYSDFSAMYTDKDLKSHIPETQLQDFNKIFTENLAALLTYRVPDKININYKGKNLLQHSLGQRASALILFILSQKENEVIIIDQPEDDLDNQTIYNDVIKLLKSVKPNIQCIFATHNANFPVLGDAEMVHAFSVDSEKINIESGNIDMQSMQEKIVNIMEGGKEAFKKREEIYSSWKL